MLLDLDEVVCPHCRTPRDEREIEAGHEFVKMEAERARRKPRWPKLAAAGAGLAVAAWLAGGPIARSAARAWNEFAAEVEKTRQPGHWRKSAEPAPLASPAAAKPEIAVSSYIYLGTASPPPPPEAPAPAKDEPEAEPAPKTPQALVPTPLIAAAQPQKLEPPRSPDELRVHGQVYDLETGRPVSNVKVRFMQKGSALWETMTDAAGGYQVGIFKNVPGAISVMIDADGYRKGLLEDQDPPYRERSTRSRADLIAETIDSDLEPVPLRFRPSAEYLQLDLVLVPLAKK